MLRAVVFAVALGAAEAVTSPPSRPALTRTTISATTEAATELVAARDTELVASVLDPVKNNAVPIAVVAAAYLVGSKSGLFAAIGGNPVIQKAAGKAFKGGISGMVAGVIQVLALMWLRTVMNYQYRYGGDFSTALTALWGQGGLRRLYKGLQWAVIQNPLSRFGDVAANQGVLEIFASSAWGQGLPVGAKTAVASAAGSLWRIAITPIDTLKTTMQVEGADAYQLLLDKVAKNGFTTLYAGCIANAVASFVGNFPWWFTFNQLNAVLPKSDVLYLKLLRQAALGISASFISDLLSNSIRVVKTTKQTSKEALTYLETIKEIVDKDGVLGLFTRGLGTRVLTNCIQATLFTVVWKLVEDSMK